MPPEINELEKPASTTPPASDDTPPAGDESSSAGSDTSWENLLGDDLGDEDVGDAGEGGEGGEDDTSSQAPATTPAAPATPPASTPTEIPAPASPPTTTEAAPPTQPPQPTAAEIEAAREAAERDMLSQIEARYQISEEEANAIAVDPKVALPKLLARAHLLAARDAIAVVTQMLPQHIAQLQPQLARQQEATKSFFDAWPDLNKPEYFNDLTAKATAYRAKNPTAAPEVVIKNVGLMFCLENGLPIPDTVLPGVSAPATPPVTPAQRPNQPALPGAASHSAPAGNTNPFVEFANELIQDD